MAPSHAKIPESGFKVGIGFMMAVAIIFAVGRIFTRIHLNHKIFVEDGLHFFAVVTLIAGTILTYVDIPYIYLQQNVQSGAEAPPADLVQQLIKSVKIQDSAVILLSTAIFAVKLSFMIFFRSLLRRVKNMMIWWWFVLIVVIPSTLVLICSNFISCSYYDERILVKCVTPSALHRQNAALQASATLDILSDALIISIPVLLLWRVKIELRRRIALGAILSLSIFTIITSIVRIGGGKSANGQIDSSWVVFWLQVEASVAVIVISVSAYRALYVAERSRKQESPKFNSTYRERLWSHSKSLKTSNKGTGNLPSVPNPTLSGVRTYIERAPVNEGSLTASQDKFLPPNDQSILVTKELSSHKASSNEEPASSYEMV